MASSNSDRSSPDPSTSSSEGFIHPNRRTSSMEAQAGSARELVLLRKTDEGQAVSSITDLEATNGSKSVVHDAAHNAASANEQDGRIRTLIGTLVNVTIRHPPAVQANTSTSANDEDYPRPMHRAERMKPPPIPRKSSKRRGKGLFGRRKKSPPAEASTSGTQENVRSSRTLTMNPLRMNPPRLKPSITAPLNNVTLTAEPAMPQATNPDDIAQKVANMLAATAALKPETSKQVAKKKTFPAASPRSVLLRMEAFKKFRIASAWRFGKGSKRTPVGGESQLSQHEEADESTSGPPDDSLQASIQHNACAECRMRTEVATELEQIHAPVENRIPRKPVATGGKSCLRPIALEDPFAEPASSNKSPTLFETRLRKASSPTSETSFVPRAPEPLGGEDLLVANPEDPFAGASISSSTPAARQDVCGTGSSSATTKQSAARLVQNVENVNPQHQLTSAPTAVREPQGLLLAGTVPNAGVQGQNVQHAVSSQYIYDAGPASGQYNPVSPVPGTKRHPSPSRTALSYMQVRMQQMLEEHGMANHVDRDELQSPSTHTAPHPFPGFMSTYPYSPYCNWMRSNGATAVGPAPVGVPGGTVNTYVPQAHRVAHLVNTLPASAEEPDELQLDTPVYDASRRRRH